MHIPAGRYRVSQTIYLPAYVNIIGDGREKTILELNKDPDVLVQVAKPMLQTIDSRSTSANRITYSNIQNSTRPKEIYI